MKVGVEIEFSDAPTLKTARELFESWGRDPGTFQDRYGAFNKPKNLDYSQWNCMSDGSLRNTDGTRCMWSYRDPSTGEIERANASKDSDHRKYWRGIELLSPAYNKDEVLRLLEELEQATEVVRRNGGVASRKLFNSMHVHIDVSEWGWEKVADLVPYIYDHQDLLEPLGTEWHGLKVFRKGEVEELQKIRDAGGSRSEWYSQYLHSQSSAGKFRRYGRDADRVRRLVDVGPYFHPTKSYQTVEFRCFSSSFNPELQRLQIELAMNFIESYEGGTSFDKSLVDEILRVRETENA